MRRNGFTLIEVICVGIILAVLAAVLMPVFASAKLGSRAESAKSNLHGFWRGILLYQSNYDEKVPYGTPEEMGLPSEAKNFSNFVDSYTGDYHRTWDTKSKYLPCGKRVGDQDVDGLGYMPLIKSDWYHEVNRRKGDTVLMYDKNCNLPDTRIMCQFCDKRSIGITLNGSIRDKRSADWPVYDQHFYQ